MSIRDILRACAPVMPVVVIEDAANAVPLAKALAEGGLGGIEVTLRTAAGVDAIAAIASEMPDFVVGAGTVLNNAQMQAVADAGAQFAVSPGLSAGIIDAAKTAGVPLLPGVLTPSEVIMALDAGLDTLKFFPASIGGGVPALKAFGGPFGDVRFCPTGGISANNAADYLALKNVMCVGGSWIADAKAIRDGD
ncbi:MAG: bifunctional 4-hydroxy-2-oxoglutarate aldolase/2-dehydro-3-deoxy-phosphogluconate aldolase, partial [Pseudomonadota bacterium]